MYHYTYLLMCMVIQRLSCYYYNSCHLPKIVFPPIKVLTGCLLRGVAGDRSSPLQPQCCAILHSVQFIRSIVALLWYGVWPSLEELEYDNRACEEEDHRENSHLSAITEHILRYRWQGRQIQVYTCYREHILRYRKGNFYWRKQRWRVSSYPYYVIFLLWNGVHYVHITVICT